MRPPSPRLRNGELAYVPPQKITSYLLSSSHPAGKGKAKFFRRCGYNEDDPARLEGDLLEIARTGRVEQEIETPYGTKYVVTGIVVAPTGRQVHLITVWNTETDDPRPRLVTAYPRKPT